MDTHDSAPTPKSLEREHLYEVIKEFDTAMLVTRASGDSLHARPMAVADIGPLDAELWFVTSIDSRKAEEIREDNRILIVMQASTRYLTISGEAEVVQDAAKARELWRESWRIWFKDKDDPKMVLVKVQAQEAEYWDNSGPHGLKFLAKAAAAYLKGETLQNDGKIDPETHGKVTL